MEALQGQGPGMGVLLSTGGSNTQARLEDITLGVRERGLRTPVDGVRNLCLGQVSVVHGMFVVSPESTFSLWRSTGCESSVPGGGSCCPRLDSVFCIIQRSR